MVRARALRPLHARPCQRALCLALALALASAPPVARAAPAEEAAALYEEGVAARDSGELALAAERFAAAYALLPQSELERRASILFELIDAHRGAYTARGRPYHLCQAEILLRDFIVTTERGRGRTKSRDLKKANELLVQIRADLDRVRYDRPELDCANEPANEPERPVESEPVTDSGEAPSGADEPARAALRDPVKLSGIALTGAGGLLLGLVGMGLAIGKQAEFEGTWLLTTRPQLGTDAPEVQDLDRWGRRGNTLAIVGGAAGGVLFGVGVTLLVMSTRRARPSALTSRLGVAPHTRGLGLTWRF